MFSRAVFTTIFLVVLASCSAPEVSETSRQTLDNLRTQYSRILTLIPEKGSEQELNPSLDGAEIGRFAALGYKSGKDIPTIEFEHLAAIATQQAISETTNTWLSSARGGWDAFDANPFQREGYYRVEDHDEDVILFGGAPHLLIYRTDEFDPGEIDGENIIRGASYSGWFWLVDVNQARILGCKKMEAEYMEELIFTDDTQNVLSNRLRQDIYSYTLFYINEWCGTEDIQYM